MRAARDHPEGNAGKKRCGGIVVTFVSGQAGVGQSQLARDIGGFLAQRGRRTLLLTAPAAVPHGPAALPERLAIAAVQGEHPVDEWRYDFVLIDAEAGFTPQVTSAALAGDWLLLVTTPAPAAVADGYAVLKMLRKLGYAGRTGVVVTRARSAAGAAHVAQRLRGAAERFLGLTVRYFGAALPAGAAHPAGVARGASFSPPATRDIARICGRLLTGPAAPPRAGGMWTRVGSLLL
jgi:MinD-like ATPase involved in chromosome partitioning or flagellar assembly